MAKLILTTAFVVAALYLFQMIGLLFFGLEPILAYIAGGLAAMGLPLMASFVIIKSDVFGKIAKSFLLGIILVPSLYLSFLNFRIFGHEKITIVVVYCTIVVFLFTKKRSDEPDENVET